MNPKGDTIEAFFSGEWEVKVLKGIYVVHLYSVFPEYLFVCKYPHLHSEGGFWD